jgi:hypothetical protein
MNAEERRLWLKIENFQFDKPGTIFTFTRRLANENGWNFQFAERVVQEYKKFLFMCCISKNPVTPSDAVDQAWHLHLTYTKSYWIDLCENTLQKKIHHNPTQGGKAEGVKFDDWYTRTKQFYFDNFRQIPPSDIWLPNDTRFSDIDFARVNKSSNWVIPKPSFKKLFQLVGIVLLGMGSIYAKDTAEETDWGTIIFVCVLILLFIVILIAIFGGNNRKGGGSSSSGGCSSGGWFIFSGCGSTDSGCGGSGCSGCGGGGCGGCGS